MDSTWGDEVAALVALVSLMGAATSWWLANRSRGARTEAERARDEAAVSLAAMQALAAAAERAFPKPPATAFIVEKVQREFRLRNVGTGVATAVRFAPPENPDQPLPTWTSEEAAKDIAPGDFADFEAVVLYRRPDGLPGRGFPRWVWVVCEEHPEPIKVEMPVPSK